MYGEKMFKLFIQSVICIIRYLYNPPIPTLALACALGFAPTYAAY